MFRLTVYFQNGSKWSAEFNSMEEAYRNANAVSLDKVYLMAIDGVYTFRNIYHDKWDEESKLAGLKCPA